MGAKVIRARPGKYKGVEYRSQLEVQWAKWFEKWKLEACYVDLPWCDFVVDAWPFLGAIEIKPPVPSIVVEAIKRWFDECDPINHAYALGGNSSHEPTILVGSPPGSYGMPMLFRVIWINCDRLMACWGSLCEGSDCLWTYHNCGWSIHLVSNWEESVERRLASFLERRRDE